MLALLERNIERNGAGELIRAVACARVRDEVPALERARVLERAGRGGRPLLGGGRRELAGRRRRGAAGPARDLARAHTPRRARDRLDATIGALSAAAPLAEVVGEVRGHARRRAPRRTTAVVLLRHRDRRRGSACWRSPLADMPGARRASSRAPAASGAIARATSWSMPPRSANAHVERSNQDRVR